MWIHLEWPTQLEAFAIALIIVIVLDWAFGDRHY